MLCIIKVVRTKNEVNKPTPTWAHNLLVMWVLDFLLWLVLNAETQQSDLSYEFLYSHCYYSVALSLPLLIVSYATLPIPSFASHIYSQKLVQSYDYFHG